MSDDKELDKKRGKAVSNSEKEKQSVSQDDVPSTLSTIERKEASAYKL